METEHEYERLSYVRPTTESTMKAKLAIVPPPNVPQRSAPPPLPSQRASRGIYAGASPAPTQAAKTFDELYDEGVDAILRKCFDEALSAFRAADDVRPGDPRVRANLERLVQMGHRP